MKKVIRLLIKILIGLAILFLCFYFILALKAHQVTQVRMMFAFQEGKISEREYNQFLENHKFVKTLLNPKYVFSVDLG
jgi:hypothetical protein